MRGFAVAVCLACLTGSIIAAPLPPEAKEKDIPKISGTTWEGDGVVAPTVYVFEKDGGLTYTYSGNTYTIGSWKQEKDEIYWEANNRYCEFKGKIEGETITGKAWNVTGKEWNLTFKLQKAKNTPEKP